MSETFPVAAISWRGDLIENTHLAHVAVVDQDGRLLRQFGSPQRLTLARSAAKPAQALAVIETGALERFGFDLADLALMCGSHSSEPRHIARARAMLGKAGLGEADLHCGGHPALSDAVQRDWLRQGFEPGPLCSNCSGKHAGMLAAALTIGAPTSDYHLPQHPLQLRIRATMAALCGLADADVLWSVDGCNLPTPAFPLDRLALLYARLAAAADASDTPGGTDQASRSAAVEPVRTAALARIYHAMAGFPELVAGEGRFCTRLIEAFAGGLVGKIGADASYAIAVRRSSRTAALGASGAVGISVKIEDGNSAVVQAVVCEVLRQLGLADTQALAALGDFHAPPMRNTAGLVTGHLSFPLLLGAPANRTASANFLG